MVAAGLGTPYVDLGGRCPQRQGISQPNRVLLTASPASIMTTDKHVQCRGQMLASKPGGQLPLQATCTAKPPPPRGPGLQLPAGLRPFWPQVPGINLPQILTNSVFCTPSCLEGVGSFPFSLPLQLGRLYVVRGAERCSGEKWKGIKLNRGRVTFPGVAHSSAEAGAGAGGGSRGLRRTQARRAHMVPGSLRGRRVTVVARLGGSLASRLPGTTSGLGPAAHPGWRGVWVGEGW